MSLVLDASAAVAWVVPSQSTAAANSLLETLATEPAIAPAIYAIELRNALLKLERRGMVLALQVDLALDRLGRLVRVVEGPAGQAAADALLTLARIETLSVFDAAYLELALREGAVLASRDGPMLEAARRRGLEVRDLR